MSKGTLLTEHGSIRMKERINNQKRDISFLRTVLRSGKSKIDYTEDLYRYLKNKEVKKNIKAKIYKENVYIFGSKNNHKLITTYPVPEKYLPTIKYELNDKIKCIVSLLNHSKTQHVYIKTRDYNIDGKFNFYSTKPLTTFELIDDFNNLHEIITDDIIELQIDEEVYKFN